VRTAGPAAPYPQTRLSIFAAVGLLLEQGIWFEGRPDAEAFESTVRWKKEFRPRSKECFFNAQQFWIDEPSARYFEG
jgi:hypothetical protein